jgi:hypothetical protein
MVALRAPPWRTAVSTPATNPVPRAPATIHPSGTPATQETTGPVGCVGVGVSSAASDEQPARSTAARPAARPAAARRVGSIGGGMGRDDR